MFSIVLAALILACASSAFAADPTPTPGKKVMRTFFIWQDQHGQMHETRTRPPRSGKLIRTERREVDAPTPTATKTPLPTSTPGLAERYERGREKRAREARQDAERTIAAVQASVDAFFSAWFSENWAGMAASCQPSWVAMQEKPARMLKDMYGFRSLASYKIGRMDIVDNPFTKMFDVNVSIVAMLGTKKQKLRSKARVVLESGKWCVNPISALPK